MSNDDIGRNCGAHQDGTHHDLTRQLKAESKSTLQIFRDCCTKGKLMLIGSQRLGVILLLLAIGPALIAIHPSIPFLNDGMCDAWYVFGLFYHLPDALQWPLREGVTIPYQTA